jgi:predicted transposase YbfD/YdcC
MDTRQYSTLMDALKHIPDPRKSRGKRHTWLMLLTILVSGLASGYQSARAIAHWAKLHASDLQELLPALQRIPSESTILRAIRQIDAVLLDQLITAYSASLPSPSEHAGCIITLQGQLLQGQALDGKTVRGASAHGDKTHLVSLVQHASAITLAQSEVASKQNEISAAPLLLRGRDLNGTVTTGDALLTQRSLAEYIHNHNGYYLMIVKRNQRQLWEDLELLFRIPPITADQELWDRTTTVSKGHGRLETRTLECGTGLIGFLTWPGVAQVARRHCERVVVKSGKRSEEISYGITNLAPSEVRAAQVEALWRGHWTIENRKHYVRDVTLGEDRNQMHSGNAPHVLASLRSGLIDLWRSEGWSTIAEAIRECAASVQRTLILVGALSEPTLT